MFSLCLHDFPLGSQFHSSSQKHAYRWIGYSKLPLGVNALSAVSDLGHIPFSYPMFPRQAPEFNMTSKIVSCKSDLLYPDAKTLKGINL